MIFILSKLLPVPGKQLISYLFNKAFPPYHKLINYPLSLSVINLAMSTNSQLNWIWCFAKESALAEIKHFKSKPHCNTLNTPTQS